MRAELENMERVANYLAGKLTESQRQVFEADLLMDNDLQDQLHFQTDLSKVIERRVLRNEISQIGKQYGGSSLFSWKMMVITAVVIAGGITAYFAFTPTTNEHDSLIAQEPKIEQSVVPQQMDTVDQQDVINTDLPVSKPMNLIFDPIAYSQWQQQMISNPQLWNYQPNGAVQQNDLADAGVTMPSLALTEPVIRSFADSVITFEEIVTPKQIMRSGTWWKKPARSSALPSLRESKTRLKNKALIIVIDEAGNKLPNVAVEYGYYGELRSGTTDKNGEFAFQLYDQITSSVKLLLPDQIEVDLTEVVFQPKKVTYIQVDSYTIDSPVNSTNEGFPTSKR